MNELIVVNNQSFNGNEIQTVNARDLHTFLESKQEFSHWIKNRIKKYSFSQSADFITIDNFITSPPSIDYHLTLDMAKELSMVERNEKGKQARLYFLECEKVARQEPAYTLPSSFKEALLQLASQVEENEKLQLTLKEQAPKVQLAEAISASPKSIKVEDLAKVISNQAGFVIGRNNFFGWLRWERFIDRHNMPFQRYIDCGWLEVKESTYEHCNTNGPQVCFTTMVTGLGQGALLRKFLDSPSYKNFLTQNAKANRYQPPSKQQDLFPDPEF